MAKIFIVLLIVGLIYNVAMTKPLDSENTDIQKESNGHGLRKRFVNAGPSLGGLSNVAFSKIRTKRNTREECEKLRLCKLHAQASRNFISAFQLYFVNKENARLWDHQYHSPSDCERLYDCYE